MADDMLKADEVADMLGMSRGWVFDMVEQGRLPVHRVGDRALRFRRSEIEAWLESRRVQPPETTATRP